MEVLTEQIAKLLQISVDKVVEVYPIIRTQMVWYNSIDNLIIANMVMLLLIFAPLFGGTLYHAVSNNPIYHHYDEEQVMERKKARKNIITKPVILLAVSIILAVVLPILRNIMAPDVTVMMMLGK